MAQEIVTWCDVHMDRDERIPAKTVTVSLDGIRPRQIDLCGECDKEILGRLRDLIEDAREAAPAPGKGVPGETLPDASGRVFTCPLCPDLGEFYETPRRGNMRDHMRHRHDQQLNRLESEMGRTLDGLLLKFPCDVAGCGLKFSHGQGLGAHKRTAHDVKGSSRTSERYAARKGDDGQEALAV